METQQKIDYIIRNSASYLSNNLYCKEDKIFHRGRNSYLWTILLYLYKKDRDSRIIDQVYKSQENYKECFSKNKDQDLILLPGLKDRGNYSTNAIDCGIFLDTIHDKHKMIKISPYIEKASREIFFNYAYKKLLNKSPIHNQYLWLLTGFSRCIGKFCIKEDKDFYKKFVIEVINSFYEKNSDDGFCVYSGLSNDLNHMTTYYHSRCLVFVSYSLDNISYSNKIMEDKFYKGAIFLAKMYKNDGIKSLSLESKRYYFHNNFELGSIPYDLYVFEKAYNLSNEDIWLELASKSLDRLYEEYKKFGHDSYSKEKQFYDWQCNIMRVTHNAWLTRLSIEFLLNLEDFRERNKNSKNQFNIPSFLNLIEKDKQTCLLVKGNQINNYQFLATKAPISSLYGQRSIGIQPTNHFPISNLLIMFPYEYRSISLRLFSYRNIKNDFESIKGTLLQIKDTLIRKRNIRKAFEIFRFHLLYYLLIRYLIISSSFPLTINNLDNLSNSISHEIDISDIKGLHRISVGYRKIIFNNKSLTVDDFIFSKKFMFFMIPKITDYVLKSSCFIRFNFYDKYIFLIFGPFQISYLEN